MGRGRLVAVCGGRWGRFDRGARRREGDGRGRGCGRASGVVVRVCEQERLVVRRGGLDVGRSGCGRRSRGGEAPEAAVLSLSLVRFCFSFWRGD